MIRKENFGKAYKQVLIILGELSNEDRRKIPKERYEYYKENMDQSFEWEYKKEKPLEEQGLLYEAKAVLANLFYKYLANKEEKERIEKNDNRYKLQQYKRLMVWEKGL